MTIRLVFLKEGRIYAAITHGFKYKVNPWYRVKPALTLIKSRLVSSKLITSRLFLMSKYRTVFTLEDGVLVVNKSNLMAFY